MHERRKISHKKVLAVVVSFNGRTKTRRAIEALEGIVEHVLVVDNGSEKESLTHLAELERDRKISVVRLPENRGIGHALNIGVSHARSVGCDWLLTLDQDSVVDSGMLDAYWRALDVRPELVCLTPNYRKETHSASSALQTVEFAITSGNLTKLNLFDHVGLFDEAWFIDYVDVDFSLRVRSSGFQIWCIGDAKLLHEIGDKNATIPFSCKYYMKHPPLRRYYMYRNHLYLAQRYLMRYPMFIFKASIIQSILLLLILLFEAERWQNIKYILWGIFDFCSGRVGRFNRTP